MDYDDNPLDILPGIYSEDAEFAAGNRFVSGLNVRFWKGFAERIGGWATIVDEVLLAPARGMLAWRALNGSQFVAFGSAEGLEVLSGSDITDISPIGVDGYITLIISVSGQVGSYTNGETVTATGGGTATVVSSSAGTVNVSADSGTFTGTLTGGGATATITGTLAGGRVDGSALVGWGESTWGSGVWGGAETIYANVLHPTTWTLGRGLTGLSARRENLRLGRLHRGGHQGQPGEQFSLYGVGHLCLRHQQNPGGLRGAQRLR
jgi:hypothetical protein